MSLERVQELEAKVSAMSEDKARLMATVAKWEAYSATQTERAAQDTQLMRKLEDALEYLLSESDAGADFGMSGDDSPGQAAARDALKAFSARQATNEQKEEDQCVHVKSGTGAGSETTAQVRCVGCSGILIQQNLCHDCAESTQDSQCHPQPGKGDTYTTVDGKRWCSSCHAEQSSNGVEDES